MSLDGWRDLEVAAVDRPATGITRFVLRDPEGGALPQAGAGAHVRVRTPAGHERKYSLCNDPAEDDHYEIAVLRVTDGRGGSIDLIDQVKPGDRLPVSAPRNDFALVDAPAGYLFIAGGIGITPILSMVRQLRAAGNERFRLVYLSRSPGHAAWLDELTASGAGGQITVHHDGGDPDQAFDLWPLLERAQGRHVYCCGPTRLMDEVRDMTGHWPAECVHFEAFAEAAARPKDQAFAVRLARSGVRLEVPVGASILDVMRLAGHDCPSSCESGSCGTCRTRLIEGAADHRDFVLADHEKASQIMICVSRAQAGHELVIDR
jgi:phthalate 4,5-dioxygenase reductase subunit